MILGCCGAGCRNCCDGCGSCGDGFGFVDVLGLFSQSSLAVRFVDAEIVEMDGFGFVDVLGLLQQQEGCTWRCISCPIVQLA